MSVAQLRRQVGIVREKVLQVVSWSRGQIHFGEVAERLLPDCVFRTFDGGGIEKIASAELVVPMEPIVQRFVSEAGTDLVVQTFRMQLTDGVPRRWLFCGSCGDVMVAELMELGHLVPAGCRRCSAPASQVGCTVGHSFGKCDACKPRNFPP